MTRKVLLIALAVAMVSVCVPIAFAATPGDESAGPAAGLTETQKARLEELRGALAAETEDLREQARSLREELRDLMANPDSTAASIQEKWSEFDAVRAAIRNKAISMREELKSILTTEQLASFSRGGRGLGTCLGLGLGFEARCGWGSGLGPKDDTEGGSQHESGFRRGAGRHCGGCGFQPDPAPGS